MVPGSIAVGSRGTCHPVEGHETGNGKQELGKWKKRGKKRKIENGEWRMERRSFRGLFSVPDGS